MDGKIIQYIAFPNYQAILTDKGTIYERRFISEGSWEKWHKKEIAL